MECSTFQVISSGWFWMGSEAHYIWESPRHRVFVDDFEISATTVTRREYAQFLTASGHAEPKGWGEAQFSNPEQPVVGVSWFDATAYCSWLSSKMGQRFRLPTEAEWEKACRGGLEGMEYAWGNDPPESLPFLQGEWHGPRPVLESQANPYGLFHMGDNVHEWCVDWYSADYYATSPDHNPKGPERGTRRVSRGGSWRHLVKGSRAAHRSSLPPEYRYTDYGFRLVRAMKNEEELSFLSDEN
jgi:formylglycine-generating enzyme required for sulfatase activity